MKITRLFIVLLLVLGSNSFAFTQNKNSQKSELPKAYWLKVHLAFPSDCKTVFSHANISFMKDYCDFVDGIEQYSEVRIKRIVKIGNKAKVLLEVDGSNGTKEIFLENKSKEEFKKAFDFYFSAEKIDEEADDYCVRGDMKVDTKEEVLRCWGFPNKIAKKGESESWDFNLGNIGAFKSGFDISRIQFRKNIIVEVSGSI